jgi:hypothetical protein
MSIQLFYAWNWFSLDVGDVFIDPLNGATVTISSITTTVGAATSIAYTHTGTFTASPATLATFRGWLTNTTLVRSSYRGGVAASPQWPISEWDKAGISSGETNPTI